MFFSVHHLCTMCMCFFVEKVFRLCSAVPSFVDVINEGLHDIRPLDPSGDIVLCILWTLRPRERGLAKSWLLIVYVSWGVSRKYIDFVWWALGLSLFCACSLYFVQCVCVLCNVYVFCVLWAGMSRKCFDFVGRALGLSLLRSAHHPTIIRLRLNKVKVIIGLLFTIIIIAIFIFVIIFIFFNISLRM